MSIIYCVACECESSGAVDWYKNEQQAEQQFDMYDSDELYTNHTLIRFNLDLDVCDKDVITNIADSARWALAYKPHRVRIGTDGYLKKALQALA